MSELVFNDLRFSDEKEEIKVYFYNLYHFKIPKSELEKIAKFKVKDNSIEFDCPEKRARLRFNKLLDIGFNDLKCVLSGNKAIYIHKGSGIPLRGLQSFGLVDRNTNLIEVKPLTGCNFDCIFCSVDEGKSSKKVVDFVVENDFLVQEFKKIVKFKGCDEIEANINPQGEPLLYAPLAELIKDLASIKEVKEISIDTNGLLLSKQMVDKLAKAGLTQICFSLNALDANVANKLAGTNFDVDKVIEVIKYIPEKCKLNIAPIYVPGINDSEIEKIIGLYKQLKQKYRDNVKLGIQNLLNYKHGRNPVKALSMDKFFSKLKEWEKKYGVKLIMTKEDYNIIETKKSPRVFKKGDVVKARIVAPARMPGECIATAKDHSILVKTCKKDKGEVRLRILRTKHSIYSAVTA